MKNPFAYVFTLAGIIGITLSSVDSAFAIDRLVYDSITGATIAGRAGTTGAGGRSTIGNGFNFGNFDGLDIQNIAVDRMQFRLVTGATAENYNALQVRIQFYNNVFQSPTDLFTEGKGIYTVPLTPSMLVDITTGLPVTNLNLAANRQYDIDLSFATPSVLDYSVNGVAINFQGDQGNGFVNTPTNLSTVLRRGNAFGVGSTLLIDDVAPVPDGNPDGGYFRDTKGNHDLNFDPNSDTYTLPLTQNGADFPASYDAVYMRLYAAAPVVVPEASTIALFGLGVGIPLAGLIRRRRK